MSGWRFTTRRAPLQRFSWLPAPRFSALPLAPIIVELVSNSSKIRTFADPQDRF
jgi:hypothetical protein